MSLRRLKRIIFLTLVLAFICTCSFVLSITTYAATYDSTIAAPSGFSVDTTRLTLKVATHSLLTAANYPRWVEGYVGTDALAMWYTEDGSTPEPDNPNAKKMGIFAGTSSATAAPFAYIVDYKGGTAYRFTVSNGDRYGQTGTYTPAMNTPRLDIDNNIKPQDTNPMFGLTDGLYKRSDVAAGIRLYTDAVGGSIRYQTATCTWNAATSQFGTSTVDSVTAATLQTSGTLYNPANPISAAACSQTNAIAIRAIAINAAGTASAAVTYKIRVAEDIDYITLKADKDGNILVDLDTFIAQLTLQEKLWICSGVGGDPVWLQNGYNYPYEVNNGGTLRTGGPAGGSRGVPRFNIPSTALADGPAGIRMWKNCTIWMCPAGIGATWNADLATRVGERYAVEAKHFAIDYVLGPGVNNQRNPLSGRNFEYYSEDPYVGGKTAAAQVRGMRSGGVGATLKHFAANDYETGRSSNAYATERSLREIYLRAFEIAVKEGKPTNLMTGYNGINGQSMASNTWANTNILRGEWGFDGFVMTDWGGDNGTAGLNAQVDMAQSATRTLSTYTTWVATPANMTTLNRSVKNVLRVLVKTFAFQGAYGVLQPDGTYANGVALDGTPVIGLTREDIGLRNEQFGGSPIQIASSSVNKQAADEAIVLLKNKNDVLPLKGNEKIALVTSRKAWLEVFDPRWYGDSASIGDIMIQGTGSAQVRFNNSTEDYALTLVEALNDRGFNVVDWRIDYGVAGNNNQAFMNAFYNNLPHQGGKKYVYSAEQAAGKAAEAAAFSAANGVANATAQTNAANAAAAAAQAADVGIFVISRVAGEGADVTQALYDMEAKELIVYNAYEKAFHAAGKPMIVLINVGGTANTTAYRGGSVTAGGVTATTDGADAILDIWNPGSAGTDAIADILKGAVNPSGRLAQTFPVNFNDSPSVYLFAEHNRLYTPVYSGNGYNNAAYYADGVYVGYRFYETRPENYANMVAFPFGYGLSYTKFEYSNLKLNKDVVFGMDAEITATVTVKNVGEVAGKEVVQLYLNASTWEEEGRPKNELRAFGKTKLLAPNESETITLTIGYDELTYYDDANLDGHMHMPTSGWAAALQGRPGSRGWVVENDTEFTVTIRTNGSNAALPNQPIAGLSDTFLYSAGHNALMESFDFLGETIKVTNGVYAYDVNVPDSVSNVAFTASNIKAAYPDDVDVTVSLSPTSGAVGTANCVATVTLTSKLYPTMISKTYTLTFGHMAIANLVTSRDANSWSAETSVRFSDGVTGYRLVYAVYKDGKMISVSEKWTDAIGKHKAGSVSATFAAVGNRNETSTKIFLWDQNYIPLKQASVSGPEVQVEAWKRVPNAAGVVAGRDYLILSGATATNNRAMVNSSVTITAVVGLGYTALTVNGDYITSATIPANAIWTVSAGSTAGTLRFRNSAAGGLVQATGYLGRTVAGTGATAAAVALGNSTTATNVNWRLTNTTGGFIAMENSNNSGTLYNYYMYVTNTSGFRGYYNGTAATTAATLNTNGPLKFYEKVTEWRPVD